jgi:hypothetical protein
MPYDKIEKIEKISEKLEKVAQGPGAVADPDHFAALMKQQGSKTDLTVAQKQDPSAKIDNPFETVRELNQSANPENIPSANEIVTQTQDVIGKIDTVKEKLATPGLEISGPVRNILRNKLEHIDESLKIALSKAGGEYKPFEKPTGLMSPIDRFIGLLQHGQSQLDNLASTVTTLQDQNGQLSPANMLLIQIKVAHISQEIELFTSMLNKALESTKAIMNVQV